MEELYSRAKLVLLPSKWEPWGLVINEAMACGAVPLVSAHVGAANDLVMDQVSGFVLELDSVKWADGIERLAADPESWALMSSTARSQSLSRTVAGFADGLVKASEYAVSVG